MASSLGDWVGLFALQVLVVSIAEPGSRIALFGLGALMTARLLPSVLLGPVSGVIADRFDRRRLMVLADFGRGALFVAIAFSRDIVTLFVLVFLVEALSMLYLTAKTAVLPAIVDRSQLTHANQVALAVTFGPVPFGGVVAALMSWLAGLLAGAGLPQVNPTVAALLFNAATFLVAGVIILRMRLPRAERGSDDRSGSVVGLLVAGLRFVRHQRMLGLLIVGVVGVFFGAGVMLTLGPEYVRAELGRDGEDWYGLMAVVGFGLLAGFAVTPAAVRRLGNERLFPASLVAAAALSLAPALLHDFRAVQGVGFLLGAFAAMAGVAGFTMLQERSPDEVRARAFSVFFTATRVALFAALALAPFAAGLAGVREFGMGPREVTVSGTRMTILAGGLVALATATVAGWRMVRDGDPEPGGPGG